MKQKILQSILRKLARGTLRRYRPLVVAVTGSVGKSSTKEAVALVLGVQYTVRKTEGNYNNEFGAPLTILGLSSGGSSMLAWLWVLLCALWVRFGFGAYPNALVLELGIDRPGDMTYLLSFIPVDIGIVTHISGSHLEYFKTLAGVAKEKGELLRNFAADSGVAIVNADNTYAAKLLEKSTAKEKMSYGFTEVANIRAMHAALLIGEPSAALLPGYSFKLQYDGKTFPVRLPLIVAEHHLYAALAALSVAIALKMNLVNAAKALETFAPLPGRLFALPGTKETILLDDTYNASPASTKEALKVLGQVTTGRRVAVLGDMLELGPKSDQKHAALKEDLYAAGVGVAVLVGNHMRALYEALQVDGRLTVYHELDPSVVAKNIQAIIQPGDTILLKGSQGMRIELVTKALLADEDLAQRYLCRQSPAWIQKPFTPPQE
jgi:UDP-N-acetylmuramoyl-tripeptide--D-alanyl-D-alanine ligase